MKHLYPLLLIAILSGCAQYHYVRLHRPHETMALAMAGDGGDELAKAQMKSVEIKAALSSERVAALQSKDMGVKKQAIEATVTEELKKNTSFLKLPEQKQHKITASITAKMLKMEKRNATPMRHYGHEVIGINSLLLIGLIILIVGALFTIGSGVIYGLGIALIIIGVLLAVFGLVQTLY